MLVRATFAYIEGYLFTLNSILGPALSIKADSDPVARAKLLLLFDEIPRVDNTGKITLEEHRMPFVKYCAFLVRAMAECWKVDPTPFFGDNGWCELQKGLQVRHRITHPKVPQELNITQAEMDSMDKGCRWLISSVQSIFKTPAPRPTMKRASRSN